MKEMFFINYIFTAHAEASHKSLKINWVRLSNIKPLKMPVKWEIRGLMFMRKASNYFLTNLQLKMRKTNQYVDPMTIFSATIEGRVIRLPQTASYVYVPVEEPKIVT